MTSKVFTSSNGWFQLNLPWNWDDYDLEGEEGTYGFFNSQSSHWTGNLRVTPLKLSPVVDKNDHKIEKYIDDELAQHEGAIKIKMGEFDCAFYKEERQFENEQNLLYYWIMGKRDFLFVCSFTVDKKQANTKENELEFATVQNIIKSIQII